MSLSLPFEALSQRLPWPLSWGPDKDLWHSCGNKTFMRLGIWTQCNFPGLTWKECTSHNRLHHTAIRPCQGTAFLALLGCLWREKHRKKGGETEKETHKAPYMLSLQRGHFWLPPVTVSTYCHTQSHTYTAYREMLTYTLTYWSKDSLVDLNTSRSCDAWIFFSSHHPI